MNLGATLRNALLAAGLLTPIAAHADVTADQADELETQIHDWLAALLGPNVPLADQPVHVTAEADEYRLEIPYAGEYAGAVKVTGDPLTVMLKPLDDNRWSIEDAHIPSPLRVENEHPTADQPKSYGFKIAEQTTKGVLDTSFKTTTSFDTTIRDYTGINDMAAGPQTTHLDRYVSHTTWEPAADGRLNLLASGHGEGLSSDGAAPDGSTFKLTASGMDVTAHADKVAPEKLRGVIKAATDMIPLAKAAAAAADKPDAPKPDGVPADMRPPLHALVASLRDVAAGMEEEVTMSGLAVQAAGHGGSLAKWTTGFGFGAPGGRADFHMTVALDGLDSPEIPPGVYRDFLPKHLMFKPRVSGVPMDDLVAFLNHAIDRSGPNGGDMLMAEAMGLLAKGPLSIGLDDLAFDSGPATLAGSGAVAITDPSTYSGQAQLRATGFDALMQKAGATPELQAAGPVLIFLKGIGKQDGDALVWNVVYQEQKLLVNGTDLSSMMPGGAGK